MLTTSFYFRQTKIYYKQQKIIKKTNNARKQEDTLGPARPAKRKQIGDQNPPKSLPTRKRAAKKPFRPFTKLPVMPFFIHFVTQKRLKI